MASPDLPPPPSNHKDEEEISGKRPKLENYPGTGPNCEIENDETANLTPPPSGIHTEASNKRKRGPADAGIDNNKGKISAHDTPVVDTASTTETHVAAVETGVVKEVEMKDAEAIDELRNQGIKEVEMQDAEVVYNETAHVEEKSREEGVDDDRGQSKPHPESNLNVPEGCKQDEGTKETEQPTKVEEFERKEKQSIPADMVDGSGEEALEEVATLLKQVQESDAKAKLEVELKVKKIDDGVVNENGDTDQAQSATQVSCG